MQTDNQVVRAAFEKAYPMPFACGWNNMTHEYECIWFEHAGEESVEAAIEQHNDCYKVWQTSRQALEVKLPETEYFGDSWSGSWAITRDNVVDALEEQGLKVAP